jgi:WD40 repeat protein
MIHSLKSPISLPLTLVLVLAAVARAEEAKPAGRPFQGHQRSVLCVRFTHDGKTLISSSRDHRIKVWDVATGQLKQTLTDHSGDVYSVVFSHDGRMMASGAADKKIILWDATTLKPIRTLDGHTAAIRELAFSPDDKTLASVGEDSTFRLWDVATGKLKVTRTEHTQKVKSVDYYPDGKTIATVSADMTVRVWDADGEPKQVLSGHKDVVEDGAVSPDGKQIVSSSGTNYGQLIFWDARSGKMLYDLPNAHGNDFGKEVDCVAYSPDGKWAVSGSKDRTIKFWDPKTFQLLHTIGGNPGRIESMCFSPDGKTLATGFGGENFTIMLWDLSTLKD